MFGLQLKPNSMMARPTARNIAVLVVLFLFVSSCSRQTKEAKKSATSPGGTIANSIHFEYAVYKLRARKAHTASHLVALRDVLKRYPDLKLVDDIPAEPQAMVVRAHVQRNAHQEYPPPDMKFLHYFGRGISSEQAKALQDSDEALILEFAHPKKYVWGGLRTANVLVEDISRAMGGLVWDEAAREIFSPDAWHEKRLASWVNGIPDVSTQTVIHTYREDEFVRAITLGMAKMGLPDVVVENSSWSSNNQVGGLINLFCQSIAEGKPFHPDGEFKLVLREIKNGPVRDEQVKTLGANATGIACITLKQGKREEGDPKNRLVELAADKYPGNDIHAKQDNMLSSFFGWQDSAAAIHHNDELLAASAKAKAKLPELRKAFIVGLEPDEFIEVKAPFPTPDGNSEWMWVEVTSWKDDQIKGLLLNEPFTIPTLHAGQTVEVRQEAVFDYIRRYPDKRTEGNTTGDIIKKMDDKKDRIATSAAPAAVPACSAD
jgi:uncharacterized protein YegJ (DUF2314 family)